MKERKQKTLGKKLLVALLSVMMTVTFIPTSLFAFAAEPDVTPAEVQDEVVQDVVQTDEEVQTEPTEATEATEAVIEEPVQETEATQPTDAEQKEEVKDDEPEPMPAKLFKEKLDGVTIEVDTPEGTFDQKVKLVVEPFDKGTLEYMASKFVLKKDGQEFDGMLAYDIHFENSKGKEVEPNKTVAVDLTVEKEALEGIAPEFFDADSVQVAHIGDNGDVDVVADVADETKGTVDVTVGEEAVKSIKASFKVNSFSTFPITWEVGEETQSATIHWGTMEGSGFKEFESTTTVDSTASSVDLAVNIDGYYYVGATYKASESADPVRLNTSTIKKDSNGVWTAKVEIDGEDDSVTVQTVQLADKSNIYAIYAKKGGGGYEPPPKPTPAVEGITPETEKSVKDNEDGTYTITLDITGHQTEDVKQGANVIVILDMTQSMTGNDMGGGRTRIAAAKSALLTLIDALDPGYSADNPDKNLINFALTTFGNTMNTTPVQGWTQDRATMEDAVDRLSNNPNALGTNWQAGLEAGESLAEAANADPEMGKNPTYVIFVTDGNPNCWEGHTTSSTQGNLDPNAVPYAQTAASSLTQDAILYGVFCGPGDGSDTLDTLVSTAHGAGTVKGTDSDAIEAAFSQIAGEITEGIAASNVTADDGIPSLSNISANVTAGEAGGYNYYIKPADGTQQKWEAPIDGVVDVGPPGATYDKTNGVTWDLGEVGTLKEGWVYSIEFTVWPSQEAYDTIADLNNKKITMTDEELDAAGIGKNADGTYYLLTNTHLNTTFTDPSGNEYQVEPEDVTSAAMALPTTTINIVKYWNNKIDGREATDVKLTVTKDGEDYLDVQMGEPEQTSETTWKQSPEKEIFISYGLISSGEIKEKGHEYTVVEPEDFSYRWDLTADVYRPMIVDNVKKLLVKTDNPSGTEGTDYYTIEGNTYQVTDDSESVLTANNDRRSNLAINKVVTAAEGTTAPDEVFPIKITLDDTNSPHPGEEGYSDYYDTIWFAVQTNPADRKTVVKEGITVEGATAEEGDTGFYWFDNGGSATVYIHAGQYICVTNIAKDTEYTVEELTGENLPDGFKFTKAESGATNNNPNADAATPATISDNKAEGTIDQSNSDYTVTYKNEYAETDVTVTKEWAPEGVAPAVAASAFGDYLSLLVNDEASTKYDSKREVTGSGNTYTIKYKGLPKYIGGEEASYKVKEDTTKSPLDTYTVTPEDGVAANGGTITNTLPTGDLKITKAVEGIELSDLPKSLKFTVTGPNSYKNTIEYGDFEEGSYTIKDLALGEYTVTEDTDSAAVDGYTLDSTTYSPEGGKATVVEGDDPVEVTVTNTYSLDTGKLKIVKKVDGLDASKLPEGLKFTVTGPNDYSKEIAYTDFQDGEYTIEDELPVGEYTVAESDASVDGYTLDVTYSPDGGKVKVKKSETPAEVTVTNKYTEITPEIPYIDPPVKKVVKGDAPKKAETYTFMLECYNSTNENGLKPMPEAANGQTSMTMDVTGACDWKEFGEIYFTEEGVYDYRISEVAGSNENCEYDTTVYLIRATVTKDADGNLVVTKECYKNDENTPYDEAVFEFVNTYTAEGGNGTKTGDDTNLLTPIILLILAGLGIATLFRFRRREDDVL